MAALQRVSRLMVCTLVLWTSSSSLCADDPQTLQPFLQTYCTKCHGPDQQKGERRFDRLPAEISDDDALVDYQDILDQLTLSEMPPKKAKQPTDDERQTAHRTDQNTTGELSRRPHANRTGDCPAASELP